MVGSMGEGREVNVGKVVCVVVIMRCTNYVSALDISEALTSVPFSLTWSAAHY